MLPRKIGNELDLPQTTLQVKRDSRNPFKQAFAGEEADRLKNAAQATIYPPFLPPVVSPDWPLGSTFDLT